MEDNNRWCSVGLGPDSIQATLLESREVSLTCSSLFFEKVHALMRLPSEDYTPCKAPGSETSLLSFFELARTLRQKSGEIIVHKRLGGPSIYEPPSNPPSPGRRPNYTGSRERSAVETPKLPTKSKEHWSDWKDIFGESLFTEAVWDGDKLDRLCGKDTETDDPNDFASKLISWLDHDPTCERQSCLKIQLHRMLFQDSGLWPADSVPSWWSENTSSSTQDGSTTEVLFCTESGFLGIGSSRVAEGDNIAILDRTEVPMALAEKNGYYTFEGYVYIPMLARIPQEVMERRYFEIRWK